MVQHPGDAKRLNVVFLRTASGGEPVREWLKKELTEDERWRVGTDIKRIEYLWPVGLPTCRPLTGGLWEVRSTLRDRIARVIFCIEGSTMLLLHGFVKKTATTPDHDLQIARSRKREFERFNVEEDG